MKFLDGLSTLSSQLDMLPELTIWQLLIFASWQLAGNFPGSHRIFFYNLFNDFSTMMATNAVDLSKFNPVLTDWFNKVKSEIPNYEEANGKGAAMFGQWYTAASAKK
jgi:hypothetical protein